MGSSSNAGVVVATAVAAGIVVACALVLALPGDEGGPDRIPSGSSVDVEPRGDRGAELAESERSFRSVPEPTDRPDEAPSDEPRIEVQSSAAELASRYPLVADRISVDGSPLVELDLETCERRVFQNLLYAVRDIAKAEEERILANTPRELREVLDPTSAKQRRATSPESYLIALPAPKGTPFGEEPFVDVSTMLTPELVEARALEFDVHNHPRFVQMKTDAALSKLTVGSKPIAEWVLEDWGAMRVALDAAGNEVIRIGDHYLGMP